MKCAKDGENQESRGLRWQQSTMSMALLPWCLQDPKASIVRILKNKIGKYDKELNGIVISYKNVKVLQNFGCIRQDTAEINVDIQIEFLLFQPEVGTKLHGIINKKSITHLSVLVHKIFNVVIPRPTDDINFKWVGDQLKVGQKIPFTIVVVDLFGALPYIRGDLNEGLLNLAESEEKNLESFEDCSKLTAVKVSFAAAKPNIANSVGTNGNSQSTSDPEKANTKESAQTSSSDEDECNVVKNSKEKDSTSDSSSSSDSIKHKDKRKKQNSVQDEPKINNKRKRSVGAVENSGNSLTNLENGNKNKKIKLEAKATKSASSKKVSNAKSKKKAETKSTTDSDSDSSVDDIVSMRNKILAKVLNKKLSPKKKNKKKS